MSRRELQRARESRGEMDFYRIRPSDVLGLVHISQPDPRPSLAFLANLRVVDNSETILLLKARPAKKPCCRYVQGDGNFAGLILCLHQTAKRAVMMTTNVRRALWREFGVQGRRAAVTPVAAKLALGELAKHDVSTGI